MYTLYSGAVEMTVEGYISNDYIAELYEDAQLVLLLTPPEPEQKESRKEKEREKEKEKERDLNCSDRTSSKVKPSQNNLSSSGKHFHFHSYSNHWDDEGVNPPSLFMCQKPDSRNLTDPGTLTVNIEC